MPRVPVINSQSVMPVQPYGSTAPVMRQPDYSTARLVSDVGRSVAQAGGAVLGEMERQAEAQRKAEAKAAKEAAKAAEDAASAASKLAKADAMLAFDGAAMRSVGKFKREKGLGASEKSAATMEELLAERQRIAEGIPDAAARQDFLLKSSESLLQYQRQVEGHVASEFDAAREATAKGRESQLLAMSEAGVTDFGSWLEMKRAVEADVRGLASSPEAGEAAAVELESKAGAAFVTGLVAQGRHEDASSFVDANRGKLGSRYAETKALVDRAAAGAKKDAAAGDADRLAMAVVMQTGDANGFLDEAAFLAKVDAERPADPEKAAAFGEAAQHHLRRERARLGAETKKHQQAALRADLDGKPLPGESELFLRQYDPDFLRGLKADQRARFRQWKTERDGNAREQSQARQTQAAVDLEARNRFAALSPEEQAATTPEDFAVRFAAQKFDEEGIEVSVSPLGRSYMAKHQRTTVEALQKGEGQAERRFTAEFEREVAPIVEKKGKAIASMKAAAGGDPTSIATGNASAAYRERVAEKGRALTADEEKALRAELLSDVILKEGRALGPIPLGGEVRGPRALAPRPTGPAQQRPESVPEGPATVRIRRKADGKVRVVPAADAARFLASPAFEQVP